jgi:membrane associated rhomboid family serine protease
MIPLRDDNPTSTLPVLTVTLIAANVLIFFYQVSLGPEAGQQLVYQFGAVPAAILGTRHLPPALAVIPPVFGVFTSMFLHGGWLHLIGNMLYLWIFGNNIEDAMGHARYLLFYLVCGVASSFSHILSDAQSVIPSIGASGAISGVLGAYLLLYPRAKVLVLIPLGFFTQLMYIPASIVLGLWFLLQLLSSAMSGGQGGGGIAWWAHIGGFLAGVVLVGLFKKRQVRFFNPPLHRPGRYTDM